MPEEPCPYAIKNNDAAIDEHRAYLKDRLSTEDHVQKLLLEIAIDSHRASQTDWRELLEPMKTITSKLKDVMTLLAVLNKS